MVSMLGMVLGVTSLIVVLTVMNGFAREQHSRILSLVPHGYIQGPQEGVSDWRELQGKLQEQSSIVAASPYITNKVIFRSGRVLRGAVMTAIDPGLEKNVSRIPHAMVLGDLDALSSEGFNVVLGSALARVLGVFPGDKLEVTVPRLTVTPLGVFPRSKRLTVVGLFEVGAQPDAMQAYVSLETGQRLMGLQDTVQGLQLKTPDLFTAPEALAALAADLPQGYAVKDWSQTQGSLFRALKMEKVMVSLLLLSVIAVAAFNIVSTLVMSVTEKRRDIAVLRTMGARAGGIMAIFVAHGLGLAAVGIAAGAVLGIIVGANISEFTAFIEASFGVKLFDPAVYFISELPSELQLTDVAWIVIASLSLSLIATLYPAWRAARIAPAEVLRYE